MPRPAPSIVIAVAVAVAAAALPLTAQAALLGLIDFDVATDFTGNFGEPRADQGGNIAHNADDDANYGAGGFARFTPTGTGFHAGRVRHQLAGPTIPTFQNFVFDADVRFSGKSAGSSGITGSAFQFIVRPTATGSSGRTLFAAFGVDSTEGGSNAGKDTVVFGRKNDYFDTTASLIKDVADRTTTFVSTDATINEWIHLRLTVENVGDLVTDGDPSATDVRLTLRAYDSTTLFDGTTLLGTWSATFDGTDPDRSAPDDYTIPGFIGLGFGATVGDTVDVDNVAIYAIGDEPTLIPEPGAAALVLAGMALAAWPRRMRS